MLRAVLNAHTELFGGPTPLTRAAGLSSRLGLDVFIKREDLTPVFSFKVRGACNRIARLSAEERQRGVIAASAGNHAQGVAYACQKLGIRCRIVMPRTTPGIKVEAVRRFGVQLDLVGDNFADAAEHCAKLVEETGMVLIQAFDDLDVIAGQGTVGLELLQQAPRNLDAVFVPVGGGGLISGIAAVIKELRPEIRVIGVQAQGSDAMTQSMAQAERVKLARVDLFVDGVAVSRVGVHTLELCRRYVDEMVVVGVDPICTAIRDAFLDTRTMLEPAGALSIAGLKHWLANGGSSKVCAVIASGANISYQRFGYVMERAATGDHREAILAVNIPERMGSFREFCTIIERHSITEFNYRLNSRERALIFVGLEVSGAAETEQLCETLRARGYRTTNLSDDEVAKTHVRHMVGGRAAAAQNEVLYAFEFPERPAAFSEFLNSLSGRWNISLFHYRNHGAAFGRVLCGMEVPKEERPALEQTLRQIGFHFRAVTNSPAMAFLTGNDELAAGSGEESVVRIAAMV
jgi:threonine dehydratase